MKRVIVLLTALATALALAVPVGAADEADRPDRPLPEHVEDLKLSSPRTSTGSLDGMHPALQGVTGDQQVIVQLTGDSLAESGITDDRGQSRHVNSLERDQNALMNRIERFDPDARLLGSTQRVLNAVFVEVSGSALDEIAEDDAVRRITPVANYEMDLSETVPYIGADSVQADGHDGSGIAVAVLDSGVDYLHANLGGSGDPDDYANNDPTVIEPGTFPTDKVVDGFDFVGDQWPEGALAPDPDPLDSGPEAGHGTHVADIIAGSAGVAPEAEIYAVKVCSSVSPSCSGVALILGMEFAVDPNFDGQVKDRVDIINMSLGSLYGQPFDDDLSQAVDGATELGVLTVASAGNSADKPFITGSPAAANTALSVAQTQVPSATQQLIGVDGVPNDIPAVFQPWSVPLTETISGPVQYGDGAGGNLNGCAPFAANSLDGLIVLVDRGACNFTLKISNISQAGGEAGIIGLVTPGAPFQGGDGGDRPIDIPGYMISQADSNAIKAALPANGTIDPANQLPLIGQMVGSSSRGPQFDDQRIKPEIGAPGASVSAIAGTGSGEGPFGGTSGAAPMVSGSAALVLDALGSSRTTGNGTPPGRAVGHGLKPLAVKALLMNTAETDIDTDPFTGLAPVSRIGGGEVRVDRALEASAIAYDADEPTGALSFFYNDVTDVTEITKTVEVMNLTGSRQTYNVSTTFRAPGPEGSGAVTIDAPSSVSLRPGKFNTTTFDVTMTINGSLLGGNPMNSGANGASGDALTAAEYDGYITLEGAEPIHLAWHVLPRAAADVEPETTQFESGFPDTIGLTNNGVGAAQLDAYSMVATSPELPKGGAGEQAPTPDLAAVGVTTFPVPADFCSGQPSFVWAFAFDMHERVSHAVVPTSYWLDLDTDQDGTPDYAVFTWDLAGIPNLGDGRVVTWAAPYTNYPNEIGTASAFFFAEHATVTGNTVLWICGEQVGLSGGDIQSTNVDAQAFAFDIYFGGPGDATDLFTITPLGEQYFGVPVGDGENNFTDLPGNNEGFLDIYDFGLFPGNTPEEGVLLLTNGDRGPGARGGATEETEAIHFLAP